MTVELNRPSPNRSHRLARVGLVVLHWTGGTFGSAVNWCCDPRSEVSYNDIVAPDGRVARLVPYVDYAAWAVGFAAVPPGAPYTFHRANHESVNLALAGGPPIPPTAAAVTTLVERIVAVFRLPGTDLSPDELWRIIGHEDVAVYGPEHKRAGQFGRKDDPTGRQFIAAGHLQAPWLDIPAIRARVRTQLLNVSEAA